MRIKNSSIRIDFCVPLSRALDTFDMISTIVSGHDAMITCGSEQSAKHSYTSLHYDGKAADLRSKWYDEEQKQEIIKQFKEYMPIPDFDLILEGSGTNNEHFHLEYQPKRR